MDRARRRAARRAHAPGRRPSESARADRPGRPGRPRRGGRDARQPSAARIVAGPSGPSSKAGVRNVALQSVMHDRTIGRAAFLGVVGAGVAGLVPRAGRDALRRRPRARQRRGARPDVGLAHLHDRQLDPAHRPGCVPAHDRRAPSSGRSRSRSPTSGRCRGRQQVSDFHCVTGWSVYDVRWAACASATCSPRPARDRTRRRCGSSRTRCPYDDTLSLPQAFARRRDARARHGREAALGSRTASRRGS